MKPLASIERIQSVSNHPNADRLDIVSVAGYECIVGRDQWKIGDRCVFIQPDSVLPSDQEWSADLLKYTSSGRVKAAKLRGSWSMGIVIPPVEGNDGDDVSELLGITKHEPPIPQDLKAKSSLPWWLPRTDEERWQNIDVDSLAGAKVHVTLKIDGSSWTAFHNLTTGESGVCSRSLVLKDDADNPWTKLYRDLDVKRRLAEYCEANGVSIAIRGEMYGNGIQRSKGNPHAEMPLGLAVFSVYLIDYGCYAAPTGEHNSLDVANALGLAHVPIIYEESLTREMIHLYDSGISSLAYFQVGTDCEFVETPFEGVVVRGAGWSFKIINKHYDSLK